MSADAGSTPRDVLVWVRAQDCAVSVPQIAASMHWSERDVTDALTALILQYNTPLVPCGSRDGVPLWECMEATCD